MRLKSKTLTGVAWSGVENWSRQLLSFAIFATLARLLSPEDFGLVALAAVYVALVDIFVTQGLGTAVIQRHELEPGHLDSAFWIALALGAFLCLSTLLLASPVASIFGEPRLASVLRFLSLGFIFLALAAIPSAILTRRLEFRALAVRSVVSTIAGGAVGITMAALGYGVWSLVGQQLMAGFSGMACLWWEVGWRPRIRLSWRHVRDLAGFALSIMGNNILWLFCQRTDQTLIGYGFGAAVLGPYALAARVTQLMMDSVAGPLQNVSLPAFSRVQMDRRKLKESFFRFTETGAFIAFPACAGLIVLAYDIVPLLFGREWTPAAPVLQVLAAYAALRVAMTFFHPLMLAKGRPGLYLALFALNASGTLVGCLIAIQFSPRAVAFALVVNIIVHSLIFFLICGEVVDIQPRRFLAVFRMPLAGSLAMAGMVWLLRSLIGTALSPLSLVLVCVPFGILVYALLVFFFRRDLLRQVLDLRPRSEGELAVPSE